MKYIKSGRVFAYFASITLIITAGAKLISCVIHPELGQEKDVVFHFLSVKQLLEITALLELFVAGMCGLPKKPSFVAWLSLFWLSSVFLLYRFGPLIILGRPKLTCHCLGYLSLVSDNSIIEYALITALAIMWFGSLILSVREIRAVSPRSNRDVF